MNEARVLKICLLGLPLGLILFGGGSLLFYETPKAQQRQRDFGVQSQSIQAKDLLKAVRDFAVVIGPRNAAHPEQLRQAANYIESTLGPHNAGYQVRREGSETLVAELAGNRLAKDIVIVGAHYDSTDDSAGANDNGTGMAALFGLAQSLAGAENERTLRFIAFAHGPAGSTKGSAHYARECQARDERIMAMICLEGLGWFGAEAAQDYPPAMRASLPPKPDFLAVLSDARAANLVNDVASKLTAGLNFAAYPGVFHDQAAEVIRQSDAWSFLEAGYSALLVTSGGSLRQTPRPDTPESIDQERFVAAVQALNRVVHALANPRS